MAKTNTKYNATEVHITRSVAGLFLFAALAVSVWMVRHFYREVPYLYIIAAAIFTVGTAASVFLVLREKKAGAELKIFGADYWTYIAVAGLIVHACMALALSENLRSVIQPVMYVILIAMYVIYITSWNLEKNFRMFACLCGAASVLPMLHYQCFYDQRIFVGTNPIPMISANTRSTVGWVLLAVAAVAFLWLKYKKGISCWKQQGVLGILAIYWLLLFILQDISFWLTLGVCLAVAVYFILLRILKQIRVIG